MSLRSPRTLVVCGCWSHSANGCVEAAIGAKPKSAALSAIVRRRRTNCWRASAIDEQTGVPISI